MIKQWSHSRKIKGLLNNCNLSNRSRSQKLLATLKETNLKIILIKNLKLTTLSNKLLHKATSSFFNKKILPSQIIVLRSFPQTKAFLLDNGSLSIKVKVANSSLIKQVIMKIQILSKNKTLLQKLGILLKKIIRFKRTNKCIKNHRIYQNRILC